MTVFVGLVMAVLTFVFIAYPFFKQRSRSGDSVEDEQLQELYLERDTTYSMLKELEFDFQSGVLTEEDYRNLEARYKKKAISILKDIDEQESGAKVEEEMEKQILALRRGRGQFCSQCGAKCQEYAHFCSYCGASLNREAGVD